MLLSVGDSKQTNDFFAKASLICIKLLVFNRNRGRAPLSSSGGPGDCHEETGHLCPAAAKVRLGKLASATRLGPAHSTLRSGAGPWRARRRSSRGGRCGPSHSGLWSPKTRRTRSRTRTSFRASESESVRVGQTRNIVGPSLTVRVRTILSKQCLDSRARATDFVLKVGQNRHFRTGPEEAPLGPPRQAVLQPPETATNRSPNFVQVLFELPRPILSQEIELVRLAVCANRR